MLKNLKIGKKLIISFVIVSILASMSGILSVILMKNIDQEYSVALVDYGFAQGDIGKLLSAFCRVDGNVHDGISYLDKTHKDSAYDNVTKQSKEIAGYFDQVETTLRTEASHNSFNTAKTTWNTYLAKANELLAESAKGDESMNAGLQKRIVDELDPLYSVIYNSLQEIMEIKVETGDTVSTELSSNSRVSIVVSSIIIIAAILISILMGSIIARGISRPITLCADRLEKLAKGDLVTAVPDFNSADETGVLSNATKVIVAGLTNVVKDVVYLLEAMADGNFDINSTAEEYYIGDFEPILTAVKVINANLSDTLSQINQAADQVSSGSDQVSSGAQALSQGATQQASSVEELAATINEISNQVKNNAANSKDASQIVNHTGQEILKSNEKMNELIKAMEEMTRSSQEIATVIKTIENIALQTNILALNAAVEAARAGDAGKGFAVVADEVRSLASKSAEAAKGTTELIESSVKAVENGTFLADDTAKSLLSVVEGAKKAVETVDRISKASGEQADSIMQVTMGVDQISSVVQTNSATAEESAAASEELSGQAQMLKELVSKFSLKKDDSHTRLDLHMKSKKQEPYIPANPRDKY